MNCDNAGVGIILSVLEKVWVRTLVQKIQISLTKKASGKKTRGVHPDAAVATASYYVTISATLRAFIRCVPTTKLPSTDKNQSSATSS